MLVILILVNMANMVKNTMEKNAQRKKLKTLMKMRDLEIKKREEMDAIFMA